MKKILFAISFLFAALTGVSAQDHWTLTHGNNEGAAGNTVVIATLNLGTSQSATGTDPFWDEYEVAAFIGNEVRACQMGFEFYHPQTQDANFFALTVAGNFDQAGTADNGKTITFKMYNHITGIEYNLTASKTCKFDPEQEIIGSPSDPVELKAVEVTDLAMADFSMKVGETVTLTNHLTLTPSNATMPNNIQWQLGNYASKFTLNGNKLTAKEEGTFACFVMLGEYNPDFNTQPINKMFTVTVNPAVERVEGFNISLPSKMVQGVATTMKLTPTNDAEVDLAQLTVTEGAGIEPYPWNLFNIGTPKKNNDGSVSVAITPQYPGEGVIEVHYADLDIDPKTVEVGVPLTLKKGWQWVTLWAVGDGEPSELFGTAVDEVRSQSALLAYDATAGWYGNLSLWNIEGYKLKANKDVAAANAYVQYGGYVNLYGGEIELLKAWTWIGYPYVHAFAPNKLQLQATNGDRIVSKDDGFVEYKNGSWTGTLTQLKPYQSYLYYNNSGAMGMLNWESEENLVTAGARAADRLSLISTDPVAYLHRNQWDYDASPFRDNMSIVAVVSGLTNPEHFSIGAFVGDECRGEGVYIDNRFFITVHARGGEQISFRLSDDQNGLLLDIDQTVPMSIMMGSVDAPVRLTTPAIVNTEGIDDLRIYDSRFDRQCYDLKGRKIDNHQLQRGIYIVDGKKVVK